MKMYLQHGPQGGPYSTENVPHKIKELGWPNKNLSYTASGYGRKIPNRYMVKYLNRWYRVYSACFSNVSREYIVTKQSGEISVTFYA